MPLNALEQKLLNLANVVVDAAAHLVAAKNPAYDSLITIGSGLVDQINQSVNPSAPAAAQSIATAASALAVAVPSVTVSGATIGSGAASATQKASAAGIIIGDVESIISSIRAVF